MVFSLKTYFDLILWLERTVPFFFARGDEWTINFKLGNKSLYECYDVHLNKLYLLLLITSETAFIFSQKILNILDEIKIWKKTDHAEGVEKIDFA